MTFNYVTRGFNLPAFQQAIKCVREDKSQGVYASYERLWFTRHSSCSAWKYICSPRCLTLKQKLKLCLS